MSKKFQLTIPEPCHEDWNKMQPEEKGRFCDSCQKGVTDFTGMSDQQLVAFFKKPSTGSVCGRFNHDQLNHDFEIPRKRIPWLKYFFTIAVPAFLASSKATAQGQPIKVFNEDTTLVRQSRMLGKPYIKTKCEALPVLKTITGKVVDEKGNPLQAATIMIKETKIGTISDSNGNFKIKVLSEKNTLVASYVGYKSAESRISDMEDGILILMEMPGYMTLGIVVTTSLLKQKPTPFLQRIFKDTAFKNFKFYPNPVIQGTAITIEWKKSESGEFEIQLLNQNGQIMSRKTENFIEKINSAQFEIPTVAPGNYFLVMTNRKTQKRITEKIIIQ